MRMHERGMASLFFAAVILPMLFFLFTLSIDLVSYYRVSRNVQQAADQAALYAYRYLPYQDAARQAAEEFLRKESALLPSTTIRVTADTVSLSVEGTTPLFFAKYFNSEAGLPVSAYASARGQPSDVYLAVDTSAYVAPETRSEPWGEEHTWPAASLFAEQGGLYDSLGSISARNATQLCFNPVLLPIKRAAISAFEYVSGFQLNAVGVGFFPGALDIDEVRPVIASRLVLPATPHFIGGGQAQFPEYRQGAIGRDLLCAAAAQEETTATQYRFQSFNSLIPALWHPDEGAPLSRFLPGVWDFNPEYQHYLSAQEVIWSAMAQRTYPMTERIFAGMWNRLAVPAAITERGTAQILTRKVGILIAGDVPWTAAEITQPDGTILTQRYRFPNTVVSERLRAQVATMAAQATQNPKTLLPFDLLYIIVQHQRSAIDLNRDAASLQDLFTDSVDASIAAQLRITVLVARSPEDLVQALSGLLVLRGRAAVLAK